MAAKDLFQHSTKTNTTIDDFLKPDVAVTPGQDAAVARKLDEYRPFVYRFADAKPKTQRATLVTAILAVCLGLFGGILGYWLLHANWWAVTAVCVAIVCSTMMLAASRQNRFYMYAWIATIPGFVCFTFCSLHLLPPLMFDNIIVLHMMRGLRAGAVITGILLLPLAPLYALNVRPNRAMVKTMVWCAEELYYGACWVIASGCRLAWGGAVCVWNALAKREMSPQPMVRACLWVCTNVPLTAKLDLDF